MLRRMRALVMIAGAGLLLTCAHQQPEFVCANGLPLAVALQGLCSADLLRGEVVDVTFVADYGHGLQPEDPLSASSSDPNILSVVQLDGAALRLTGRNLGTATLVTALGVGNEVGHAFRLSVVPRGGGATDAACPTNKEKLLFDPPLPVRKSMNSRDGGAQ
jgi:hypothetical protein